jgi:uncharacterized protein (DUF924 family)
MTEPEEIISFWFDQTPEDLPFKKDESFDRRIRDRFGAVHRLAAAGKLGSWTATPLGCLALVVTLDQFPRNMFRGSPEAFACDGKALAVADAAIARNFDRQLAPRQRMFLYLPFQHSERLDQQHRSVALVTGLDGEPDWLKYAERHLEIIARFGRFPHRNAVLGRETTAEEAKFLRQPNSSF